MARRQAPEGQLGGPEPGCLLCRAASWDCSEVASLALTEKIKMMKCVFSDTETQTPMFRVMEKDSSHFPHMWSQTRSPPHPGASSCPHTALPGCGPHTRAGRLPGAGELWAPHAQECLPVSLALEFCVWSPPPRFAEVRWPRRWGAQGVGSTLCPLVVRGSPRLVHQNESP